MLDENLKVDRWMPSTFTVWMATFFTIVAICVFTKKRLAFVEHCNSIPGPPAPLPLLGNALELLRDPDELFQFLIDYLHEWRQHFPILRFWLGPFPIFLLYTPEGTEALLGSNKLIDKSREYQYLHPWLNTGLLTSTGTKWHGRRKMLTPTFHFKILEDFIDIFNKQSVVLVQKLREAHQDMLAKNGDRINLFPYVARCTLDIICETAMGRHVDAQLNNDSEYVKAVCTIGRIVQTRQAQPWLQPELLFQCHPMAKTQQKCLDILHGFTDKVLQERKAEHRIRKAEELARKENKNLPSPSNVDDNVDLIKKPRLAFLDLLIEASQDGTLLSDLDIREEVDTFMFEGQDTTAAAVSWCLYLIGSHPEVQDRVSEELNLVFGTSDRPITMADILQLKYLECCIKEALRLYPSVAMYGRTLSEDAIIHGYVVPAGSTVAVIPYSLHRDPQQFPDPECFNPDRFWGDNKRSRHPYAYVPFSAGPRNCIGQKYAVMEEKVVLATVLRNFHLESLEKREDLVLIGELVLRPRDGVQVRLTPKPITPSNCPSSC
ncbi:cytochrome P450 4c3-like [Daphnia carinata]|uniref:cytochrome P450 4c3-like n=1 Tax=Daphnia carinata TaxID=120202 RepID=UPI00257BD503|nr:cytochrome P450 4c3-like [Daphnia carinata]XP_057365880.1 cytochrome P450 4c3-like [Daphnia carinata]